MRICNNCGSSNLAPEDLFLERLKDNNRWTTRCKKCFDASTDSWPKAGTLDWMSSFDDSLPFEVFKTLNTIRVAYDKVPVKSTDNRRLYIRHVVDLDVIYTRKRSTESRTGKVRDLSKGGVCFFTSEPLKVSEIISVKIQNPDPENLNFIFASDLEIVRSIIHNDGKIEIGGRFIGSHKKNLRKDKRFQMLLNVWYQRKGQADASEGAVLDISRRGVAMIVPEQISVGEILAVCIRGDTGPFAAQELRGLVRVAHSQCVYAGNYELGTEFIKTKVTKLDEKTS